MPIDYEFYKDVYGGTKLTAETFPKYITKGLSIISKYTMDRVNSRTIETFPEPLATNIKKCACELADFKLDCDKINDMVISHNANLENLSNAKSLLNHSNIKSITAGAVSYTINTNTSDSIAKDVSKNYTDLKSINNKIKSILNNYLYPQHIGCTYYNLMSFSPRCTDVQHTYYSI